MTDKRSIQSRRTRLADICLALPEASSSSGGVHMRFDVRGKTFAYFLNDHHGDGRVALNCKVPPGMQASLIRADPARFFVPAYLGPRGWVGLRIDTPKVDWGEVRELVVESYRLIAPKRLANRAM
jgi:phosphoribosylglycinamide formyltransferase-1